MLKCSNIMYVFEIDGTILDTNLRNCFTRFVSLYNSKLCFNPHKYDIRWSILTNRPLIDILNIKLCCIKNGLVPCEIITGKSNYFYVKDQWEYKLGVFDDILSGQRLVKYTKSRPKSIIYVNNDIKENYCMNCYKNSNSIICTNVIDFEREFFNHIV